MATVTKSRVTKKNVQGGVPFGNAWNGRFQIATNASGVLVDSDQATALAIGDVVRAGVIPAGTELHDLQAIVSDAFTALTTAGVGFQYVDGVDSAAVPQDAGYFVAAAGLDLATVAVTRKTAAKAPVTLPKDAYLIVTLAGAAQQNQAGIVDFVVQGVQTGAVG